MVGLLVFAGCRQSPIDPPALGGPNTPAFLFATDDGELRVMNIDITEEDGGDTTYTVERYSNIGLSIRNYGLVTTEYDGAYDWSTFRDGETPKAVAVLRKPNTIDPTHQTEYEKQFVYLDRFASIQQMRFFSELNQRTQPLMEYNYWVSGRTVHFIDDRYYLAYWTDTFDSESGVAQPDLPPNKSMSYVLLYDSQQSDPENPQIIATTLAGGYQDRHPPHYWVSGFRNTRVFATANGRYIVLWTPVRLSTGMSPYFFRRDGSTAYDPRKVGGEQVYRRQPGQESFAIDFHPSKDSLIVVSDHNQRHKATYILQLGASSDQPFTIRASLPFDDPEFGLENSQFSWGEINANARTWYLKFHPDGEHVAIAQSVEGETPTVTIWDWVNDEIVRQYKIGEPDEITEIRQPAWLSGDENSSHSNLLYFMAKHETPTNVFNGDDDDGDDSDTQSTAYLHYIDLDNPNMQNSRRISWSQDVEYWDMARDPQPREPQNLKGR